MDKDSIKPEEESGRLSSSPFVTLPPSSSLADESQIVGYLNLVLPSRFSTFQYPFSGLQDLGNSFCYLALFFLRHELVRCSDYDLRYVPSLLPPVEVVLMKMGG